MAKKSLFYILIFISQYTFGWQTDTIANPECFTKTAVSYYIPKFDSDSSNQKFPVALLLHGYGGHNTDFFIGVPSLEKLADSLKIIIVCPDGKLTYYINSSEDSASQYASFIKGSLYNWIKNTLPADTTARNWMISGFSMGGNGGLIIGMKNLDKFGVIGGISGVVNLHNSGYKANVTKLLGQEKKHFKIWDNHSALIYAKNLKADSTHLYLIMAGDKDYFIKDNRLLATYLAENNFLYKSWFGEGKHDFMFVRAALRKQLLYFSNWMSEKTP